MNYSLEISMKSFKHELLTRATEQLQKMLGNDVKIFYFPLKIEKITVLRSPHIDKKARDQFEVRRHKNLLVLDRKLSGESLGILFENIKNTEFKGIQMKMKVSSMTYGFKL